ncbi:2-succinyl-5-enolpyruvyl-6-hydroxy-3-cyclohexene-1-carboxylic-acid synthase [Rummeliibacillus stabekisii]|uniref:2-succinyl-5-enolpyruvyl-6-hydroxy-3- cyclohexene-1-carboxylic-acid synthase n=1 Tax=Rummeliibacillus stabekisii TaxID=241244 RepID=UPI00203C1D7F|nr:2-succinyl-5-enolpyruvyl-6-hydroxy-3-cyclohexene-1-carboxylic-acid synthase [Rummeliibacillus stabekisii]MCM3317080.1 2-succinyl-5-enolpyruvyl-6-hydroxy-3-cyclohexene-1-carboxylic-acid synthase [Rummeliibacillus stabekisii]
MTNKEILNNYVYKLVSALHATGIKDVVVSPGSRSTPLAYAFAHRKEFTLYRQVDERSAAFLALGLAKASTKPVVLVCTSGTAAANYFPAIVEAKIARVPLIVLTADRPHELREVGAPQAIAQTHLYGDQVKWTVDFPIPDDSQQTLPFIERHIARAVAIASTHPYGPVHVNVPFREPLLIDFPEQLPAVSFTESISSQLKPTEHAMNLFETVIEQAKKGFIIVGELPGRTDVTYIWQLVRRLKWPVLADSLSQLRGNVPEDCEAYIIDQYDALLKNEAFKQMAAADTVIRFGAQPVSKPLMQFLTYCEPSTYLVVDEDPMFRDSLSLSTMHIQASIDQWLNDLIINPANIDSAYVNLWTQSNEAAAAKVETYKLEESDEGAMAAVLFQSLPNESNLFASSSMPIRDVDTFFSKTSRDIHIYANRGANGIDGVVSTAIGTQLATKRDTYLLIGDLAFLHDSNGLIATRYQACDITIVIMNNDGGGIFSYLSQSTVEQHYEELFGTPSGLQFADLAKMYDAEYEPVHTKEELKTLVQRPKAKALRIIEVFTNRAQNLEAHRNLWDTIGKELDKKWQV